MNLGTRISVIGSSGSGKSWTASRLAERLALSHIELDSIRHGPNWTETPDDEFRIIVEQHALADRWVIDGNYTSFVRDLIWDRATGVVWLDYPLPTVMRQVIVRSVSRALFKTELWNGNRERWHFFLQAEHPIRWSFSHYTPNKRRDAEMLNEDRYSHLVVVRLTSPAHTHRWLETL